MKERLLRVTGVIASERGNSVYTGANAIGYANSAIPVSGEGKRGQAVTQMLNTVQPFQMSDRVLRHCGIPFVNPSENWFGCEPYDLLQFFANDPEYLWVRSLQNLLVAGSTQKTANECAVCGHAIRKLIVNVGSS